MSNTVRPWVKIAGIMLGVAAIGITLFKLSDKGGTDGKSIANLFGGKSKDVITIGVNTYGGFSPIVKANGGLEPNENCDLYKKFGVKAKIIIQDDFTAGRAAFLKGDIDVLYCTTDVRSIELGSNSNMLNSKQFMVLNFSRGADALVVNKNINTVSDLKNKKIAFAEGTASHTLLINVLETSGIDPKEIQMVKVGSGLEAADMYKANKVDAAVVWSPDDADLVASIPGTKVLFSTKQASNIVTDGLIAKDTYIDANKEKLTKLVEGILWANSEMNNNKEFVAEAAKIFAKAFGTDESFVINAPNIIKFATLGDEENLFGLNSSFNGVTADQMYTRMSQVYQQIGLTSKPLSWRKSCDTSIIESLLNHNNLTNDQTAEHTRAFTAPTPQEAQKAGISDKKVTIEFPTNSAALDNDARNIIDNEFAPIAKQFANTRIRVEGNTDNTGSAELNKTLSKQRAQAVVDYLVKEYKIDRNRFIAVGNGSQHAIDAGSAGSDKNYRTTDFQLLSE